MDNLLSYKILKKALLNLNKNDDVKENDVINAYNKEANTSIESYDFNTPFENLLDISTYYNHENYLMEQVEHKLLDHDFNNVRKLVDITEDYCNNKDFKYYKQDSISNKPLTYGDLLGKIEEKYG